MIRPVDTINKSFSYLLWSSAINCDCLRSSAICDPRSYGNQPLDRTWFYLLRSSAITIAEVVSIWSQTIADLIAICDLRSYGNQPLLYRHFSRKPFACTCMVSLVELKILRPLIINLFQNAFSRDVQRRRDYSKLNINYAQSECAMQFHRIRLQAYRARKITVNKV